MTRRLNVYGHCRHYDPQPGGKYNCLAGVDIRAHVGGPDFGWAARIPCLSEQLFKTSGPVVPCPLREVPTIDEIARDQAESKRLVMEALAGRCPACGKTLVTDETASVALSACPDGHVSMRGCKRVGEHLE